MYKVVKCPYCKKFQMTTANKSFKCIFCHRTRVLANIRIMFESATPQIASEVLMKIKAEKFKVNEYTKGQDDFCDASDLK